MVKIFFVNLKITRSKSIDGKKRSQSKSASILVRKIKSQSERATDSLYTSEPPITLRNRNSTPAGASLIVRLSTTLTRFFNGRNDGGIDMYVRVPIMTAFFFTCSSPAKPGAESKTVDVIRVKKSISDLNRHGRLPSLPIPFERQQAATNAIFLVIIKILVVLLPTGTRTWKKTKSKSKNKLKRAFISHVYLQDKRPQMSK
ncbi:hypothetical protein DERF_014494 [Dermatophagoides farinae]|uniref:Uncharacterized protein n=1 Tax=Dermatophagoides farinae TaxID=6954 RepID=A0A922HI92_DERFA|nr:hypothetical protein DERF_014494 [Dermatophagoides farinae]